MTKFNASFVFFLAFLVMSSIPSLKAKNSTIFLNAERTALKQKTLNGHHPITTYSTARKMLMNRVHLAKNREGYFVRDVYCGQIISLASENTMPNHNVINVEHTWPQSRFNSRDNISEQKSDLHHLYPTNSKANTTRGSYIFTEVKSQQPIFQSCPESKLGKSEEGNSIIGFEPPENHKGNVARALFYFSIRYEIEISEQEEVVLRHWNEIDPVDEDEIIRNNIIESIQGNRNPFVDDSKLVESLDNF